MAYWVDDGFDTWPETAKAGTPAVGLYARCGTWIARNIANGRIADAVVPGEVARMYGTAEWAQRLCDAGLWTVEGDGYRDLRYFDLNPTPDKVKANREKKAAAGRKGGLASGKTRAAKHNASSTQARASAGASRLVEPPSLPSSPKGEGRGRLRTVPDWCGRCNKDTRLDVGDDDRSHPCPRCHPERAA
jgi:hypothetical protein